MKFKIIKNISEFRLLRDDWDFLYNQHDHYSVFQSFEFNYFSWKEEFQNSENTLSIVVAYSREGEKYGIDVPQAIFPFYIDKRFTLRFINDIHSDFCDYLSDVDVSFTHVINTLKSLFTIRHIHLINLRSDTNTLSNLSDIPSACLYQEYSELKLDKGNFPNNFSEYKSKQKTEFRRVLIINKDKNHQIISCDNSSFPLSEIINLREKMILLGLRDKYFLPISQLLIIKELFRKKKIILSVVKTSEKINAISFIMKDSSQYLIWIDIYDKSKLVNLYNYILAITTFSSEKPVVINFGRGGYDYKLRNFSPDIRMLYSVDIFYSKWKEIRFNVESKFIKILKSVYKEIKR